jgi:hypothetical protein
VPDEGWQQLFIVQTSILPCIFTESMKIKNLLLEHKPIILKKWFDLILDTYPSDTSDFLKRQNIKSANPVSQIIYEGIEGLYDGLINDIHTDNVRAHIDSIVRVRAIQDFTASGALNFIFLLKKLIRTELERDIREHNLFEEMLAIEADIDGLVSIAFDIYMACREKLYELKANEMRNWTYRVVKNSKAYREVKAEE